MSLGYADKLKQKRNLGGQLGATEYTDPVEDVELKMKKVAELISKPGAKVVAFTGAGISTSIGIPDFRGPSGIWTLRAKKQPLPPMKMHFAYAKPSFTHMALVALHQAGLLTHTASQNVDCLHLRSGLPRHQLAELHGNVFTERCRKCGREYVRDFEVETVGFKLTGRTCVAPGCDGALQDNTLDWDSALPDDELQEAVDKADEASVNLVLGTSLQIAPANELPLVTRQAGGKIIIVNLQKTPRDRQAHLIVRARVDFCMAVLLHELSLSLPCYTRQDTVVVSHSVSRCHQGTAASCDAGEWADAAQGRETSRGQGTAGEGKRPAQGEETSSGQGTGGEETRALPGQEEGQAGSGVAVGTSSGSGGGGEWGFELVVHSPHGVQCQVPMVLGVRVWLPDVPHLLERIKSSGQAGSSAARQEGAGAEEGEACLQAEAASMAVNAGEACGPSSEAGGVSAATPQACSSQELLGGTTQAGAESSGQGAAGVLGDQGAPGDQKGVEPDAAGEAGCSSSPSDVMAGVPPPEGSSGWGRCVEVRGPAPFRWDGKGLRIPGSVDQVRCVVQLVLAPWADPDRRGAAVLQHWVKQREQVDEDEGEWQAAGYLPLLAHPTPDTETAEGAPGGVASDGGVKTEDIKIKAEASKVEPTEVGSGQGRLPDSVRQPQPPGDRSAGECIMPNGPGGGGADEGLGRGRWSLHRFVTQSVQYDAEAVIAAYRADPPAVKLVEVKPRKRAKTNGQREDGEPGEGGEAAVGTAPAALQGTRRSARRTKTAT